MFDTLSLSVFLPLGGLEEEFCRNSHFSAVEAAVEVGSVTEAQVTL